jgi:tetratricopeptide (TPR) repeat protein
VESLSKQTWEARARVLGPENEDTLDSMDSYALSLRGQGKLPDAEKVSRKGWEICKNVLTMDHERTLISQNNLAIILIDKGGWPEAERLLRQCYEIRRARPHGMEKQDTFSNLNNLCLVRILLGQNLDEAERDLVDGVEAMARTHGDNHIYTLYLRHMLVRVYLEKGSYEKAEKLGKKTLEGRRKQLNAGDESIGRSLLVLGRALAEQEKFADAEPLLHDAATLFRQNYGQKKDLIADAQNWLGACLVARKEFDKAEPLLVKSYDILKADPSVPERYKDKARQHVIQLYEAWGKPDKAAAYAKPGKS